jgi:TonB family protein
MVSEMLAAEEIRTADNVEEPARLDPTATFSPVYPDSLLEAQAGGSATVEFVVQQDGQVRLETLSVVSATHPAFGTAARDAVLASRFIAGRHRGQPIAQVVLLTVRFDPAQRARP